MKLRFRFSNSVGFITVFAPLTTSVNVADAFVIDCDSNECDSDFADEQILPKLEQCVAFAARDTYTITVYNEKDEELFKIEINRSNVICSRKTTATFADKAEEADFFDLMRQLSTYLSSEASGVFLRNMAKSLGSTITEAVSASGMSKPSADSSANIDEVIDFVSKNCKAEIVKPKETLIDYVCSDILKSELNEVVDFFENRKVYKDLNIELPKGILFKGPWGTGKTYAARCIAGSVDCYFMTCTASALQGMYIGSGAENIRNLFKGAKMLAKHSGKGVIIFIDELDSFGDRQSRSGSSSGEEDRTLNQLLAEMSGFENTEDILVLSATNFPERLDDALMRSGRFGRQITISYPEEDERLKLIEYYYNKLKMGLNTDLDIADISALTRGLTPADIKEVANESAILAVRQKLSKITLECVNEAINKVLTKDIRRPDDAKNLEIITVHECGHVLAEVIYNETYPIKVTNYAYGDAGGFTQSAEVMSGILPKDRFITEIKMLLAGRAAEEVMCGYITNGASSDLDKAKNIMKAFYKKYMFETYKVEDFEQIVLDSIQREYEDVFEDFVRYRHILKALKNELSKKRVLYSYDIISLLSKYMKGGAFVC